MIWVVVALVALNVIELVILGYCVKLVVEDKPLVVDKSSKTGEPAIQTRATLRAARNAPPTDNLGRKPGNSAVYTNLEDMDPDVVMSELEKLGGE